MKNVIGIGNALVDLLIRVEDEHLLGALNLAKGSMQLVDGSFRERVLSMTQNLKKTRASGGSAANTMHGLASLGVPSAFIGKIGKDEPGDFFLNDLRNDHIEAQLSRCDTSTGIATTLITPDSERTFGTYLGAAVELNANDLSEKTFEDYQILHMEGYLVLNTELVEKALTLAKAAGMTVSLDLASFNVVEANLSFLKKIVSQYVDIVFANEEEAKSFTGKSPEEALKEMASMCTTVVVKVGPKGSLIWHQNRFTSIDAQKVSVMDTTGAGDLYASGFLYGYVQGLSPEKCGKIGTLLAAKVIEQIGASIPSVTWEVIRDSVRQIEAS